MLKALEDRIIIKTENKTEEKSTSGLIIQASKDVEKVGTVVAVGPGRIDDNGNRVPLDISVGDRVIFSKYGGTELKMNGKEYLVLSARDVLAIVER